MMYVLTERSATVKCFSLWWSAIYREADTVCNVESDSLGHTACIDKNMRGWRESDGLNGCVFKTVESPRSPTYKAERKSLSSHFKWQSFLWIRLDNISTVKIRRAMKTGILWVWRVGGGIAPYKALWLGALLLAMYQKCGMSNKSHHHSRSSSESAISYASKNMRQ